MADPPLVYEPEGMSRVMSDTLGWTVFAMGIVSSAMAMLLLFRVRSTSEKETVQFPF